MKDLPLVPQLSQYFKKAMIFVAFSQKPSVQPVGTWAGRKEGHIQTRDPPLVRPNINTRTQAAKGYK